MAAVMAEEELKGNRISAIFGADANLLEELEAVFRTIVNRYRQDAALFHDDEEAAHIRLPSGHLPIGRPYRKKRSSFYEGSWRVKTAR